MQCCFTRLHLSRVWVRTLRRLTLLCACPPTLSPSFEAGTAVAVGCPELASQLVSPFAPIQRPGLPLPTPGFLLPHQGQAGRSGLPSAVFLPSRIEACPGVGPPPSPCCSGTVCRVAGLPCHLVGARLMSRCPPCSHGVLLQCGLQAGAKDSGENAALRGEKL